MSGLWYQAQGTEFAFYQISAPVAILPAIVLAILVGFPKTRSAQAEEAAA